MEQPLLFARLLPVGMLACLEIGRRIGLVLAARALVAGLLAGYAMARE